jgi:hydroxyacid-oxoacid transhydrogenase
MRRRRVQFGVGQRAKPKGNEGSFLAPLSYSAITKRTSNMARASRSAIFRLISASQRASICPCHASQHTSGVRALEQLRSFASPVDHVQREYAFEVSQSCSDLDAYSPLSQVAASNLRFGDGVTMEVGMDLKNMKARKV